jgi:hypothetical protein
MGDLFRESKVKLTRADQFIDEVDAGLRDYDSSNPISAKFNAKGHLEINFKKIPPDVLAALGDAIHNMRTALDLMATELARINNESDKSVYFPFADSKVEFPKQISKKNFQRAGDDAVALLKQFEPYTGGNNLLRAIHDLDIRDKHINILVTRRDTNDLILSYRLDEGPNPSISASGSNSHKFLDGPLAGKPLIETLKELVQLVDSIIEAFARMVELRKANSTASGDERSPESGLPKG